MHTDFSFSFNFVRQSIGWFKKSILSTAGLLAFLVSTCGHALPAKIALLHTFPVLGDVQTNLATLDSLVAEAFSNGANIVVTPELATTGFSITRDEVLNGLGFTAPYPELNNIRDLAIQHEGYVLTAIAEVDSNQNVYNTVVLYGPGGLVTTAHKRGLSGWHDRGVLPFDIVTTPYGDLGYMICSDSYLPDWFRILTLKGADLVLLPANWWGDFIKPLNYEIWQTRARENSAWFFTANRWGTEIDTRFGTPFTYDMNDAASAFITPNGDIELLYQAEQSQSPEDTILYYTVDVPQYRIGSTDNPGYSVNYRRPEAYVEIANSYYRPDLGNNPAPDLPPEGTTLAGSMSYKPSSGILTNLAKIAAIWAQNPFNTEILVLPGLGLGSHAVNTSHPAWHASAPWNLVSQFMVSNSLELIVTSINERVGPGGEIRESLLLLRPGQPPEVHGQIHDSLTGSGTGIPPATLDLPFARIGILLGRDALFPETVTHLAKSGTDILLITSTAGAEHTTHDIDDPNYFWEPDALLRMWKSRLDHVVHVVASDWTGNGAVLENTFGILGREEVVNDAAPFKVLDLSSGAVRTKFLNAYYQFDLDTLLITP